MGVNAFSRPIQLAPGIGIEGFCCGEDCIDAWVKNHSATARTRGSAVVYASYCDGLVAGFYTLSAHSVAREDVTGGWFTRNAPGQVPVVLLGMLGVDKRFQGCGLGASLLRDAIQNAMKVAQLAGAKALVVEPASDVAAGFYEHFGFSRLMGTEKMALKLPRAE